MKKTHRAKAEYANICTTQFRLRRLWKNEMLYRHCFPTLL